jgi:hypothetical protein
MDLNLTAANGLPFYAVLVPVMMLLAFVIGWAHKRWSRKQRDPVKTAFAALKYFSLIATIVMYILLLRLPGGVAIGSANASEELQMHLEKMLQTTTIGLFMCCIWLSFACAAIQLLYAAYASKEVAHKATKELV